MMKKIPHMGARIWSLLDQICFSAANFILVICFARYYSDVQVAGYGIGLSIAMMVQSMQRTCYVVQNAVLSPVIFHRRAKAVLGQHFVAWAWIIVLELFIAGLLISIAPGEYSYAIILSTFVCSLIYAQLDFDRIVLVKYGRMVDALIASVIFLVLVGGLFFAIPEFSIGYGTTMMMVGSYAILKILRLVMVVGGVDFIVGGRLARRSIGKYLGSSVLGVLGASGHSHVPLFILGAVATAGHSAAFVALRGLMQPLMVIIRSLDVIDKSLVQAGSDNSPASLRRILFRQLAVYGGLCLCAAAGVLLLGKFVIHLIYGMRYDDFMGLLIGWAAVFSMMALTFPIETVIVKMGRLKRYNTLRLVAGVVGLLLAVILCPSMGAMGAIWACIGGWIVCIFCALWVIRSVLFYKG